MVVEVVDVVALGDEHLAQAARVWSDDEARADRTLEPITADELRHVAANDRRHGSQHWYGAVLVDGEVRAVAHAEPKTGGANPHFAAAEIFGIDEDPEAARRLLAHVIDSVLLDQHTTFMGWARRAPTVDAFWSSLGAHMDFSSRTSKLDLTKVDGRLMSRWIDGRNDRASDIGLVRWVGACPPEHVEAFAAARNAMNDAPTDDLEIAVVHIAPQHVAEEDTTRIAMGSRPFTIMALDPDGHPAGFTRVHVNTFRPAASWQSDTATVVGFRHRGIGRWLKAEMWAWLRDVEPSVTQLRTANAESNDAMLSINTEMGYTPVASHAGWQAPTETVVSALTNALER